jgi:putative ABC transport system substrate-binding protein
MQFDQLKRREFMSLLGGAAAAWPLAARAQQEKIWRIGYLTPGFLDSRTSAALLDTLRQQLSSLGYTEGKNLIIDQRAAEGRNDRLPALANELVALHPNVIVAVATPAIAAAQRATSTIPIVMTPSTDPVGSGFVKSFAHPGGNITGLANMFGDLTAKSLEVLHSIAPEAKKIAVLMSSNPTHPPLYEVASTAAQIIGLSTVPVTAAGATDLDRAFQEIRRANCDAVFVLADPLRPAIVSLATAARIPAIYQYSEFVEVGGLVSYGPNLTSIWTRSAQYVDKIFKGADPADLPVEQPTRFELVLNLKTAKSLGLSIPDAIIFRADKVIE